MTTFMVVVNRKYIVKVEAETNGGAEHKILDNYNGTMYAQAFNHKELMTETFVHFFETCQTISLNELETIANNYDAAWKAVGEAMDALREQECAVKELERQLEIAKSNLEICRFNQAQARNVAEGYNAKIGLQ